jgi:hypothetical protein
VVNDPSLPFLNSITILYASVDSASILRVGVIIARAKNLWFKGAADASCEDSFDSDRVRIFLGSHEHA